MISTHQTKKDFCQVCNCKIIIKGDTCFENLQNASYIDLIITSRFSRFYAFRKRFSGFHKITLTVTKVFCKKQVSNIVRYRTSNIVRYRSHKNFNSEMFLNELYHKISELNILCLKYLQKNCV